jgi:hypothetical protein
MTSAADAGSTRAAVVERALIGGAVAVAAGVLAFGRAQDSRSAPSPAQDAAILNFALHLEHLQAAFYDAGVAGGALTGELLQFARVARAHEHAHVRYLLKVLGSRAQPSPRFGFGDVPHDATRFGRAAVTLEDLAVYAYNGQATNLTRPSLAAAAEIVSVEARHAAWVRAIVGEQPAPVPADPLWSAAHAAHAVQQTGFVRG